MERMGRRERGRTNRGSGPIVNIRPAQAEDYEALCSVLAEADLMHRSALPDLFRVTEGPARDREYIADIIASENSVIMMAEIKGELVGALEARILEAPAIPIMVPRRYAVVDNVVVKQEHRRLGIGRALMDQAHHWAKDRGVSQIELSVYEFNKPALSFYRKLGYRTTSRRLRKTL